jgi:hypothetical protein
VLHHSDFGGNPIHFARTVAVLTFLGLAQADFQCKNLMHLGAQPLHSNQAHWHISSYLVQVAVLALNLKPESWDPSAQLRNIKCILRIGTFTSPFTMARYYPEGQLFAKVSRFDTCSCTS